MSGRGGELAACSPHCIDIGVTQRVSFPSGFSGLGAGWLAFHLLFNFQSRALGKWGPPRPCLTSRPNTPLWGRSMGVGKGPAPATRGGGIGGDHSLDKQCLAPGPGRATRCPRRHLPLRFPAPLPAANPHPLGSPWGGKGRPGHPPAAIPAQFREGCHASKSRGTHRLCLLPGRTGPPGAAPSRAGAGVRARGGVRPTGPAASASIRASLESSRWLERGGGGGGTSRKKKNPPLPRQDPSDGQGA